MQPYRAPSGIRWGNQDFTPPRGWESIASTRPPGGGIYVVMARSDNWQPKPFRPLYFGECESFSTRLTDSHEKLSSWKREAGGSTLYVAVCNLGRTSSEYRKTVEYELIQQYDPPCNIKGTLGAFGSVLQFLVGSREGSLQGAANSTDAPHSLSGAFADYLSSTESTPPLSGGLADFLGFGEITSTPRRQAAPEIPRYKPNPLL